MVRLLVASDTEVNAKDNHVMTSVPLAAWLSAAHSPGSFTDANGVVGDWTRAHEAAQQDEGPSGAWVHAYLHRKEGDNSNAEYWYRRASKTPSRDSLDREWAEIAASLPNAT